MAETRPVKTWNQIAYAMGDIHGGGGFFLISTFAMFFLINVVGLSGTEAGLLFGIAKIWDGAIDPFLGWFSDRTKSRFGRRRVYFLIGLVPIFLSFFLIWYPIPVESHTLKFFYYLAAYIFFYAVSSMVMIPYSALAADMTNDPKERNSLVGMRLIFSMSSTLVFALLAQPFIDSFHNPALGHKAMGIAGGLLSSLPFILVYFGTWELPHEAPSKENANFLRNFATIFTNKTFLIQIGMYIAAYTAMDILMAWMKFYLNDYLHMPGFLSIGLGLLIITEIASVSFYKKMINKRGGGRALALGLAIMALGMLLFALQTPAVAYKMLSLKTVIVALNCLVIGFGLGAGVYVPYALLPYSIDADELITGDKRSGTYASGMVLFRQLIQGAVVMPLLGVLLDVIGYVPMASQQGQSTLSWMRILFIGLPVLLIALAIFVSRFFKMTPENHAIMIGELERLRAGGSKRDSSPETRLLCEKLTGHPYDAIYRQGEE